LAEVITMRRFAALALSVGVLATMYVAACVLPGEPSDAERIAFQLGSTLPYRVPLAGTAEPTIGITAGGQPLSNPHYRLESLDGAMVRVDPTGRTLQGMARGTASVRVIYETATGMPDTVFPVQVIVSRIVVDSPALRFTRLGARTPLSAIALDANNAAVPNVPFTWSSAKPTVAAVNDTGLVTAVDEGATTITAAADGVADTADVTVTQVAAAVRVAPELDTVRTVGRSIQLVAVAFDSSNNVIYTAKPRWTSSDTTVGRVDATGRATATGAGTARIVARVGAAADTTTLVVAQVVRFLVVTPGFDTLTAIAETTRIVPLALDSLNFPVPTPSVTWATSDTAIATVDGAGLVRAAKNGVVLVTASAAGQSAFATIVVHQQVTAARMAQDRVALVGVGDTVRLSAVGLDKNGYPVADAVFLWRSASGCVASIPANSLMPGWWGPSPLVTARGAGETLIIAEPFAYGGGGQSDTAAVSVTGAPAQYAEIAYSTARGIEAFCSREGRTVLIPSQTVVFPSGGDDTFQPVGPAWSPDGARVAFSGLHYERVVGCGIYVARADGSQMNRVADACGRPAWSPDGMKLALSRADTIYVVNADGSNVRPLFALGPGNWVAEPAWSPDGTTLAFGGNDGCLYVMNADGSGVVCRGLGRSPAWSADGSQLAFARSGDIWLMNRDGSNVTNLTNGNGPPAPAYPAWSPNGLRLVFEGLVDGYDWMGQLFVINRDGTGLQQLDTDGWNSSYPAWRPASTPP
jgi:Tol biopolymer transport system component/uncharacterized protein YjdB